MAALLGVVVPGRAFTTRDANTIFSAFNSAFYLQSGTNAWFKNTQTDATPTYFWGQAEMIECVIDSYEWNTNTASQAMITNLLNGFIYNNGTTWTSYTPYNDDVMWAVIAFARGGRDIGMTNYCALAKANFDACCARAYDTNLGGGLYWLYPDNASKNACVNGPGACAAALLYQIFGDTNYLNKATNILAWERATLFNPATGAIYDNIGTNGVISTWSSTYNQGTFLGAANYLGDTNSALLAANFTMTSLTTGGILPQYGIAGNNSGFNAIYLRWLVRFMKDRNLQNFYAPWIQTNAVAAWNARRSYDDLSWCQWPLPSPAGTNFYAWDCISSFEAMQAAVATQNSAPRAVPANYVGYWPLDAASGTIAVDATGSGNNGILTNATWSSNGRFNGCLVFNGVNSSVTVTNPLGDDFSISFWVKTTQTAGTGQWYNGAGLVDADVPFVENDFGTALVGGKFAFGNGNPDTTITSTTAINDGNWHHCVATRQQSTGLMSVYVDGALQATGHANQNTLNSPAQLKFGAIASGGGFFNGSVDDIKIFSRTLSSNDVAGLYNSVTVPPTAAPATLTFNPANTQMQLTWSEAPAANGYNIKRSLVSGGPYTFVTNVATTTFTDTGLTNNRTYYYVVSATNSLGESANSMEASATPTSLVMWLRADSISGMANNTGIAFWPDVTGNGFNALQPILTNQPAYVANGINGMPVARFNTTNNDCSWFFRPVQDDFTIIFVYQSSQGIGTAANYWTGAGLVSGEVTGTVNDFGTSLNASGQILAGTGNPDTTIHSVTGYNTGTPHLVTFKRTESTGTIVLYVDGSQVATTTAGTQSLASPNQLVLGAQQTLNDFLNGDIAEVEIFNTALADTDRLGFERTLKCKYGLAGGTTPAGATGLTAVAGNREISLNWVIPSGATGCNLWRSTNNGTSYQLAAAGLVTSSFVDTNAANGAMNYYKVAATDACGAGIYSSAVGVVLPLPTLNLSYNSNSNSLTCNWPAWASDWVLYSTTNLAPPVVWTPVVSTVSSNNNSFGTIIPMGAQNQFFRLSSP